MNKKQAEYQCLTCGFKWASMPGPTDCIKCGKSYVKWLNYEKDFVK